MPSGAVRRLTRLMRGISKTLSSCHARMSSGDQPADLLLETSSSCPPPPAITLDGDSSTTTSSFSPQPIETHNMVLPESVLGLQSRLSENLHEVWSQNKIDAGWSFGEQRDDTHKKHPCLTEFHLLTENAKSYDVILTMETLKTLAALGYEPRPVTPCQQPPLMDLPEVPYRQSNGYKPVPFDLSAVQLTREVEDLIDALAANLHEIWAKNRIDEGWKYGNSEDNSCKRSPNLVPYDKIDWTTKKANRDSVQTIVKSLLAFGSDLKTSGGPLKPPLSGAGHNSRLRTMSSNDSTSSTGDNDFLRP
ncbi:Ryanodine receptor [Hypsibius exemplaris]|uniref:Ryanodine receptor n=1 Tax=Hypsibius exemplaris TaxID=2072580 RepID=A0A1W0WD38_HYPEX|nr:Ryanodine receptor [Hypsibius exemplaris]